MPTSVTTGLRSTLLGGTPAVWTSGAVNEQMTVDAASGADTFVQDARKLPAGYFADANGIV